MSHQGRGIDVTLWELLRLSEPSAQQGQVSVVHFKVLRLILFIMESMIRGGACEKGPREELSRG